MQTRELGRTGWKVSAISFGAWAIGGTWGKVDDKELMDFCAAHLAGYKKPRSIVFLDELPKNAANKIDKAAIRKHYK